MKSEHPSVKTFVAIWGVLMVLLLATWGAAQINFGRWSIAVAMTIAVVKALLVVLVFMHVRYSSKLTWIFVVAGFFWLAILLTLTMSDYLTRGGI